MYRCEFCNSVIGPRTPSVRVVVESRPTEYPSRPKAQVQRAGRRARRFDDPGGAGYEIAKEKVACGRCASDFEAKRRAEEDAEMAAWAAEAAVQQHAAAAETAADAVEA